MAAVAGGSAIDLSLYLAAVAWVTVIESLSSAGAGVSTR